MVMEMAAWLKRKLRRRKDAADRADFIREFNDDLRKQLRRDINDDFWSKFLAEEVDVWEAEIRERDEWSGFTEDES